MNQEFIPSNDFQVIILDSTAFYAGIPYSGMTKYYTTDLVIGEIKHRKNKTTSIQDLIETGKLKIYDPSKEYIQIVNKEALETGDYSNLSKTDISVIALGLEFKCRNRKVIIISDDYSVENLSKKLNLQVSPIATYGIRKVVDWKIYCGACGKIFKKISGNTCDVCGSLLKKKFNNVKG